MAAYFDRFVRRHMNALRLARWGVPAGGSGFGPLVIYSNHPAWWDAAILIVAADRLFPGRESFAPFDAAMLEKYGIFRKMGAFPVDLDSARGAAQFLAASRAILGAPNRAVWITAQGRFADVRTRPLGLKAGVARLAEIAPEATFLPLAVEYAFWDERGAEAFLAFGAPLAAAELRALPRPERLARLETALTATLDRLSADVIAREPERFETLLAGRRGVGGVYDGWRRLAAALTGRRFEPGHRSGDAEEMRSR
ncbi:phospholipid/glycerol acyltransferase [Methylorubrum populi]|uniref:Phospholipid/glycerol acyltransferase n=2 Tax=Methylorubrum populi TaxID=223967 RepID=A0A160PIQ8_9HYPH|nr:phospholipid/glycerol acyltransferase [Methylorubrum populi]